jgi:DNA (cytosine-5)-methyltransferase 1
MNELALFAGAGGGILGGHLLGWRTVCAVEWEPYPASVLVARQNDGLLPPFPVWDDVQTFDGRPWRGIVDVVSGGFPCQDISAAGRGKGIDGERSGMWREMARVIHEVGPRFVFVENSPMLTSRGLGVVLGDLASMGFDARWGVLGAVHVGAPHLRERIWIRAERRNLLQHAENNGIGRGSEQQEGTPKAQRNVANASDQRLWSRGRGDGSEFNPENRGWDNQQTGSRADVEPSKSRESQDLEKKVSDSSSIRLSGQGKFEQSINTKKDGDRQTGQFINVRKCRFWQVEPDVGRVADGVAARVDRLKAIGNGQVPLVAATAWQKLT